MERVFMKAFLQRVLLLALMCMPWVTWSQGFNFACDFEDDTDTAAWDYVTCQSSNKWHIGGATHHGGARSLYISDDGGVSHHYSNAATEVYAYRMLTLPAGNYEFSYDWKAYGESDYDYFRVALVPEGATFPAVTDIESDVLPEGWISLDNGYGLSSEMDWTTESGMANVATAGDYRLVFYWENDRYSAYQTPVAVDNISLVLPTCPTPSGVTASRVMSGSATIKWVSTSATAWVVKYAERGQMGVSSVEQTVSEDSVDLEGLRANTVYEVEVRGVCGATDSSKAAKMTFRTACAEITLPFHTGFEGDELYEEPSCWTVLEGGATVERANSYIAHSHEGENCLKLSNDGAVASSYINHALNGMEVSFTLHMDDGGGDLEVCVVDDLSDMAHAVVVKRISYVDGEIHEYDADCSVGGIATGGYLVLRQVESDYRYDCLFIDDININVLSGCRRPASLTARDVTYNEATLEWPAIEEAYGYEVVYGKVNDVSSTMNTVVSDIVENMVVISDLEAETEYYCWVRNTCGAENSAWRAGGSFTTQIACAEVAECEVEGITEGGAVVRWSYDATVGMTATKGELSWRAQGEMAWNKVLTDETYYIIQGLEPSTSYEVRLRTICGEDTSTAYSTGFSTQLHGVLVTGDRRLTNEYIPTSCNYNNSYAQMLYKADELEGVGEIRGIAFDMSSSTEVNRTWDIYMGHTTRERVSATGYVSYDSLQLVGADVTFHTGANWCTVGLTSPFEYHSDSNLVVVIYDKTFSYRGGLSFYTHRGSSVGDHLDYDTIHPEALGNMYSYDVAPDIAFVMPMVADECESPIAMVGALTSSSAEVIWGGGDGNSTWVVEYRLKGDDAWMEAETVSSDTMTVVDNLQSGAYYQFRVGVVCGDEVKYSSVMEGFTLCAAIEVPFSEDFNGNELNACWTLGNDQGEMEPYMYSEALYMNYSAGGYAILPEMLEDVASMHMTLKTKSSLAGARLVLAVGDNNSDISTFEHVDTIVINHNDYVPYDISFETYMGEGHFVALYALDKNIYVDDVLVDMIPNCGTPTDIVVSDLMTNSVTLTWQGNTGTTEGWWVEYNVLGSTAKDTLVVEGDMNSCTLTNLNASTTYEVMIYNLCTEDTVAALTTMSFKTACGDITLPFVMDFENEEERTYPDCWFTTNLHQYGPYNTVSPTVLEQYNDYVHVLRFGDNVNMITPRITTSLQSVTVSFDAKVDDVNYSGDLAVGYTSSPTDVSGAVYVDTIEFSNTEWHRYNVSFASIAGVEGGHIIMANINNTPVENYYYQDYYNGYIDNVTITAGEGCGVVSDIKVSDITSTGVTVSFSDDGDANNYTVGYSTVSDVNNVSNTIDCSDTFAVITDLTPNMVYYTWVRINCEGSMGLWSAGPSFRTPCAAISELPYEENFDSYSNRIAYSESVPDSYPNHDMPNCWSTLNMSDNAGGYPQAYLAKISYGHMYADSATCLFMVSGVDRPLYNVLPAFETPIDSLQISFTYCHEGVSATNGHLSLGVMTDRFDTATFVSVCDYPQVDEVTTVVHNFGLDHLDASQEYVIAFRYRAGNHDKFYLGIDNVVVEHTTNCAMPEMITITDVAENSLSLRWSGTADSYHVEYKPATQSDWIDYGVVNGNEVMIDNLTGRTTYEVRLQSNCGEEVSEWSRSITVSTMCGAMSLPYEENFDSYTEDISSGYDIPSTYPNHTLPNCWNFANLGNPIPRAVLSTKAGYSNSGNNLLLMSKSSQSLYFTLPRMDANMSELQISYWYSNESLLENNPTLKLGVMTNPNDITTFIALDTMPIVNTLTYVEHIFDDAALDANTNYYIAFCYGDGNGGCYAGLEDIRVDYVATCVRPEVNRIDSVSGSSAVVTWVSDAERFEVAYKNEASQVWIETTTSDTSVVLTGLMSATDYEVKVRGICTEGDTSLWSFVEEFTTDCGVMSLPFSEKFNHATTMADLDCWERYKGLADEVIAGTATLEEATGWQLNSFLQVNNGGVCAKLNIYDMNVNHWLVTPAIYLSGATNLEFDLASYNYGYGIIDEDDKFMVLATIDEGATWVALQTWSGDGYADIPMYNTLAQHVTIDLSSYAGDTIRLAFYGESTEGIDDVDILVDNVMLGEPLTPLCEQPSALTVSDITDCSATLSWEGTASSYDVAYRVAGGDDWISHRVTETRYEASHLQAEATYEWRVCSHCEGAVSNWAMGSFSTSALSCEVPTGLSAQVFVQSVTLDWNASEGQSQWEVSITAEGVEERIERVNEHPVTIAIATGARSYQAQVRAICSEHSYSDWSDAITFVIADCESVNEVAVGEVDEHSAMVSWMANEGQSQWEVMYGERGFEPEQGESIITDEPQLRLEGLESGSDYEAYVRTICGADFYSIWSERVTFKTLESHEGIDGVAGRFEIMLYPNPTSGASTLSVKGVTGKVEMSVVDMNGRILMTEVLECDGQCEKRVDVAGLAQGTYYIRVVGNEMNSVRKWIVK